jgi:hypothetical protein
VPVSYGRVGCVDSKSFIAGNATILEAVTFYQRVRRSIQLGPTAQSLLFLHQKHLHRNSLTSSKSFSVHLEQPGRSRFGRLEPGAHSVDNYRRTSFFWYTEKAQIRLVCLLPGECFRNSYRPFMRPRRILIRGRYSFAIVPAHPEELGCIDDP